VCKSVAKTIHISVSFESCTPIESQIALKEATVVVPGNQEVAATKQGSPHVDPAATAVRPTWCGSCAGNPGLN
jgi:hypothetical protein